MTLLNHEALKEKEKKTPKPLLTRGAKVQVENKVNRSDFEKEFVAKRSRRKPKSVTEPVNIRVDNHIRNHISALIMMGHADSQRDMVNMLLNTYIEELVPAEAKRFKDLVKIYEDADVKRSIKKEITDKG